MAILLTIQQKIPQMTMLKTELLAPAGSLEVIYPAANNTENVIQCLCLKEGIRNEESKNNRTKNNI